MDTRVKEIVDSTKDKFGLADYYLKTYDFNRKLTVYNETIYSLTMEWFPNHAKQDDEDLNPAGTAVIEVNIETRQPIGVIFVMGVTYAKNGVRFQEGSLHEIVQWVEQQTSLTYQKDFQIKKQAADHIHFHSEVNGIPLTPGGLIEVKWNELGQLTSFSVHEPFPKIENVKEDSFTLTLASIADITKEQIKMLQSPDFDEEKLIHLYGLEEIYVRDETKETIPFSIMGLAYRQYELEKTLEWSKPLEEAFIEKDIECKDEVTAEQAFSQEPSPDAYPISKREQELCVAGVTDFLRKVYPEESGHWYIATLHRENGYIQATVKKHQQVEFVFQQKLVVFLDVTEFNVVSYLDTQSMLEMFDKYTVSNKVVLTKEEAFSKLEPYLELTPYYVYHPAQREYVLCGKLDCHYGVDAETGEVSLLDDF